MFRVVMVPMRRLFPTRVCNGGALNCAQVGQVNDQLYLTDGRRFRVGGQFNPRSDLQGQGYRAVVRVGIRPG